MPHKLVNFCPWSWPIFSWKWNQMTNLGSIFVKPLTIKTGFSTLIKKLRKQFTFNHLGFTKLLTIITKMFYQNKTPLKFRNHLQKKWIRVMKLTKWVRRPSDHYHKRSKREFPRINRKPGIYLKLKGKGFLQDIICITQFKPLSPLFETLSVRETHFRLKTNLKWETNF